MKTILMTITAAAATVFLAGCETDYTSAEYRGHPSDTRYIGFGGHPGYVEREYRTVYPDRVYAYPGDRAYISDVPDHYRYGHHTYLDSGY